MKKSLYILLLLVLSFTFAHFYELPPAQAFQDHTKIYSVPHEVGEHMYLLMVSSEKEFIGVTHHPDCENPRHIDNQFQEYLKGKLQQRREFPQGHPKITPDLKELLERRMNQKKQSV